MITFCFQLTTKVDQVTSWRDLCSISRENSFEGWFPKKKNWIGYGHLQDHWVPRLALPCRSYAYEGNCLHYNFHSCCPYQGELGEHIVDGVSIVIGGHLLPDSVDPISMSCSSWRVWDLNRSNFQGKLNVRQILMKFLAIVSIGFLTRFEVGSRILGIGDVFWCNWHFLFMTIWGFWYSSFLLQLKEVFHSLTKYESLLVFPFWRDSWLTFLLLKVFLWFL